MRDRKINHRKINSKKIREIEIRGKFVKILVLIVRKFSVCDFVRNK